MKAARFLGIPVLAVLGLVGYVVAFLNNVWIIYGIWRSVFLDEIGRSG